MYLKTLEEKKQKAKEATRRFQERNTKIFKEWKDKQHCLFCKEDTPCVLDFHHLDPKEKDYQIGSMAPNLSWKSLKRELDKCVILCSNCHRKLHAGLLEL
jgi:hypothetical protein